MIFFLKQNVYPLLKLAIPLSMAGLIGSAIPFLFTIFLAKLGHNILAAGALVGGFVETFMVIIMGTLSSVNILVARQHGANNKYTIAFITRDGLYLALIGAIPITLLFWNISHLFLLFGQNKTVISLVESCLHAWCWGILPQLITIVLLHVMIGLGKTRVIVISRALHVILSIFFSFILIFGKLGLPVLGIAGAGFGVSISNWICAIGLLVYISTQKEYQCYINRLAQSSRPNHLLELLQIGIPIGVLCGIEIGFYFTLIILMGTFGTRVLAAHQIVMQYYGVLVPIFFSMSQAITVRIGHLLGAGDVASAKCAGYTGCCLSALLTICIALLYWHFPIVLVSLDLDVIQPTNAEIIRFAIQFFSICALFQLLQAIRISLLGALRALKDTVFTLLVSFISFWGIALPIGYFIATHSKLGAVGLWFGMVLGAAFSVVLLLRRFKIKMASTLIQIDPLPAKKTDPPRKCNFYGC